MAVMRFGITFDTKIALDYLKKTIGNTTPPQFAGSGYSVRVEVTGVKA